MDQGLYVHIPFCRKKCRYCSFVVAVFHEALIDDYLASLLREAQKNKGEVFKTIYFGGGTPSHLSCQQLLDFADNLKTIFCLSEETEISFEANPEDIHMEKLDTYQRIGINRLSLGIQTFDDGRLQWLGRVHNAESGYKAVKLIQAQGCFSLNLDMMFGFPDQSFEDIEKDLKELVSLRPEHVSLYSLTVEPQSRFYVEGMSLPDNETQAEQYMYIKDFLEKAGYVHYEVSNFALPGFECRHNMNYWRSGDYIGLGVAAHSHRQGRRWWNVDRVRDYIQCLNQAESAVAGEEVLDDQRRLSEALVFGLRLVNGICLDDLEKRFQKSLLIQQKDKIEEFIGLGLLEKEGSLLRATRKGVTVLDEMAQYLI